MSDEIQARVIHSPWRDAEAIPQSKYAKWSMIGKTFRSSITGCSRCDEDGHKDLEWKPFTYPIEYGDSDGFIATHWCLCPTNGEPIMMGGYDDDQD